ncbi:hypothetical protein B0H10DRAFT_172199 [Mycena sp. CBHHK59/15]|nr:hypothetical protein B0H10DRAFT_172199 [Mycena sp. CBHHK59/15]
MSKCGLAGGQASRILSFVWFSWSHRASRACYQCPREIIPAGIARPRLQNFDLCEAARLHDCPPRAGFPHVI